ncbi:MAG: serine/threonine-protein kinase [Planctomycetota bacterium]|jgi:serine/threonine-protein kinase
MAEERKIDPEALEGGLRAVFGKGNDRSALARIEARSGQISRVFLRDTGHGEGPVVRPSPRECRKTGERYEIVGEIARGGIGVVLKGRDTDLGRDVALKLLHEKYCEDPEVLQRFVEEAQIGGQLQHPGIVPVHELGMGGDERPFIAMKLVKGQTLAALLAKRESPYEDRRRMISIFEQVCLTMAYAHVRGVIHRDLKPSNIMVGAYGEVQIVDWGLSKVLGQGGVEDEKRASLAHANVSIIETVRSREPGSGSLAGSVMGTPEYMPPEQADGRVEEIDERSDVFSLGAILCEILTGLPPYSGEGSQPLVQAHEARQREALERLEGSGADEELVSLTKRCLLPRQSARPRDAGVVAEAVGSWLATTEERARKAEVEAAEARACAAGERKARRLVMALAATIVLAVLLGGSGYVIREHDRRVRAEEVSLALETAAERRGEARRAADPENWVDVLAEAERILALVRVSGAGGVIRRRAEEFLAEVRGEAAAARENAARVEREEALSRELRALQLWRCKGVDPKAVDAAYRKLFAEFGVTLQGDAVAAAEALRSLWIRDDLVAALDRWVHVRVAAGIGGPEELRRLAEVASRLDGDPWREDVRELAILNDLQGLTRRWRRSRTAALDLRSLRLVGNALGHCGNEALALAALEEARRRAPRDLLCVVDLAGHASAAEPPDHRRALGLLSGAAILAPEEAGVSALLGFTLSGLGDVDGAVEHWSKALEGDPERYGFLAGRVRESVVERARKWLTTGGAIRGDPPLGLLRAAAEASPDDSEVQGLLGQALLAIGDWARARASLEAAVLAGGAGRELRIDLGIARFETGDHDGAHAIWCEIVDERSDPLEIYGARTRERLRFEEDPGLSSDAAALILLARSVGHLPKRRPLAGAAACEEAARRSPGSPRPLLEQAALLIHGGSAEAARAVLAAIRPGEPGYAESLYLDALALGLAGEADAAVERWMEGADRDKEDLAGLTRAVTISEPRAVPRSDVLMIVVQGASLLVGGRPALRRATAIYQLVWAAQQLSRVDDRFQALAERAAREFLRSDLGPAPRLTVAVKLRACAQVLDARGDAAGAIEAYRRALEYTEDSARNPGFELQIRLSLVRLLALSPDPSLRDPELCLALARESCEFADGVQGVLGRRLVLEAPRLLALAYVVNGRHDQALKTLGAGEEVYDRLIRSLALHGSNRIEEAREQFRRATAELEAQERGTWPQLNVLILLRAEAKKLLGE